MKLLLFVLALTIPAHAAPKAKARPQSSGRALTLDEYDEGIEPEIEVKETIGDERRAQRRQGAMTHKGFGSYTEFDLGVSLTSGSWGADRTNSTMAGAALKRLLVPAPAYVSVGVVTAVSPAAPRNFYLGAELGGGLMYSGTRTAPFIGFRAGAGRMVAAEKGRVFGLAIGPELGFVPFRVKEHPFLIRLQYTWMTGRIASTQPRWYGLSLGVLF